MRPEVERHLCRGDSRRGRHVGECRRRGSRAAAGGGRRRCRRGADRLRGPAHLNPVRANTNTGDAKPEQKHVPADVETEASRRNTRASWKLWIERLRLRQPGRRATQVDRVRSRRPGTSSLGMDWRTGEDAGRQQQPDGCPSSHATGPSPWPFGALPSSASFARTRPCARRRTSDGDGVAAAHQLRHRPSPWPEDGRVGGRVPFRSRTRQTVRGTPPESLPLPL